MDPGNLTHLHNGRLLIREKSEMRNFFIKFTGKWIKLEKIILSDITQTPKNKNGTYSLIVGYIGSL